MRRLLGKRSWYKAGMLSVTPLRSKLLADHGFRHGFSPRRGGVSAPPYDSCNLGRSVGDDPGHVAENRRRFAEAVGYRDDRLFEVDQVHGRDVHRVRAVDDVVQLRAESGDGLIGEPGAAVGVRTADCVPVLLADPKTRCVAALHAGWRGTVLGVLPAGLDRLREVSGARFEQLLAAVFPHIGPCCFEVSDDVAESLAGVVPRSAAEVIRRAPGRKPQVDLSAIVRLQLAAAGIPAPHIEIVTGCTRCDTERFFSYRRDGQASGRHLTAIVAD